ncbi:flagellar assembly protein FliH [Paramagnetospirillum kuznetsovii]|uniref:Flagellar assembly protein FliH n=1 Tax=Paramagnetospirillum kuznetsovii TaxID=2053833 RepID=A0A364P0D3_9PROT|nr:FliH/SctL family protein [Paramagnetospirillum kuznetsovii]RAU22763.1 flagellar assembly protein FliH [Paramagnetospirillum kuznetsovii]
MAYKKYMFDLDFGPPSTRAKAAETAMPEQDDEAEPEAPPPPTFTEEDLQVVREAAYEEGHGAGIAEATASAEAQLAEAMTRLTGAVEGLRDAQEHSADEAQRVAARVAMAVLKKVLPAACEEHAFEEVVRTVQECFGQVLDEPRIIVRTDAELVDPVRERLETVAVMHGFEGRVVVQADPRLERGDCRVEWADGGAERDQARLIADIEAAVERSLAPPERRAEG